MRSAKQFAIVLVTAPDLKTARKLASLALKARLVACANLIPKIESHYWWKGKIERSSEILLLFKTSTTRLGALENSILKNHPYDTPEFLVLPVSQGAKGYLGWLQQSVA